jgi:hypothetical protein
MFARIRAGEHLDEWRRRNPGVVIGLSPEGKRLVWALIKAYEDLLDKLPFAEEDVGHRDYLLSLLNELPPKPRKPLPKAAPRGRLFFISLYFYIVSFL